MTRKARHMQETYIGDGVYASYDKGMIKLRTERDGRDETIYLEPDTFNGLLRFVQKFWTLAKKVE